MQASAEYLPAGAIPMPLPMPTDLLRSTVLVPNFGDGDMTTVPISLILPTSKKGDLPLLAQQPGYKDTATQRRTFSVYLNDHAWNTTKTFREVIQNDLEPGIERKREQHGVSDPNHPNNWFMMLWDDPTIHRMEDIDQLMRLREKHIEVAAFPHNCTREAQPADDERCLGLIKTEMGNEVRKKMGHAPGQEGIVPRLAGGGKWNALDIFEVTVPVIRRQAPRHVRDSWANTYMWPLDVEKLAAKGATARQTAFCRPMVARMEPDMIRAMLPAEANKRQQLIDSQQLTWGQITELARQYVPPYNERPPPPLPSRDATNNDERMLYDNLVQTCKEIAAVGQGINKTLKDAKKAEAQALRDELNVGNLADDMLRSAEARANKLAKQFNNRERALVGKQDRFTSATEAYREAVLADNDDEDGEDRIARLDALQAAVKEKERLVNVQKRVIEKAIAKRAALCRQCKQQKSG